MVQDKYETRLTWYKKRDKRPYVLGFTQLFHNRPQSRIKKAVYMTGSVTQVKSFFGVWLTDGWTYDWTDIQLDRQTDGRTDGRMDRLMDRRADRWTGGRTDGGTEWLTDKLSDWLTNRRTDGRADGQKEEQSDRVVVYATNNSLAKLEFLVNQMERDHKTG